MKVGRVSHTLHVKSQPTTSGHTVVTTIDPAKLRLLFLCLSEDFYSVGLDVSSVLTTARPQDESVHGHKLGCPQSWVHRSRSKLRNENSKVLPYNALHCTVHMKVPVGTKCILRFHSRVPANGGEFQRCAER